MTQILDLLIMADFDLRISEVMSKLSYRMSIEKGWYILHDTNEELIALEDLCDKDRMNNPNRAYEALYDSWWSIRNLRIHVKEFQEREHDRTMVGGGY